MWTFPARVPRQPSSTTTGCSRSAIAPQWLTVAGGSRTYVEAITGAMRDRVRLRTPVRSVMPCTPATSCVTVRGADVERFDEVVLACHSDQALALLADPSAAEREILGAIPYQANEAVLHTDASLLPRRRAARQAGTSTCSTSRATARPSPTG